MTLIKNRIFKPLLLALVVLNTASCATTSSQSVVINNSRMEEPVRFEMGTRYDQVIDQLKARRISHSDPRDNPFFQLTDGEVKVIMAQVNSYDDRGSVNGTVSYRLSFDHSGALFDSKKSIALDKSTLGNDEEP